MACTDQIITRISDSVVFDAWKQATQTTLNGLTQVTPANQQTIQQLQQEVTQTLGCLRTKLAETANTSSDIYTLQQQYNAEQNDLRKLQEDAAIAKERSRNLVNPMEKVTVYESWFPIQRPLRGISVLVLLAFGLFFIATFFGILMRQFGFFVDIGFIVPQASSSGFRLPSWLISGPVVYLLFGALAILAALTAYAFISRG